MLASVCSYRVMVKSVSSCCVRGRWVLSNPVTIIDDVQDPELHCDGRFSGCIIFHLCVCLCLCCMSVFLCSACVCVFVQHSDNYTSTVTYP